MEFEKPYQDTLDYLYSFVDYSLTRAFIFSPENFDLDRMRAFMAHLGHPEQAYPILHVAGTKGKGSVAAMCASVFQAAGYTVGLYTSPHLEDYAERIQVNHQPILHGELIALVDEVRPYLDAGTKLTTFEITTALAFLHFARRGVNAAVIEVGLGGRLDATNIVLPVVTVITSISYDHTNVLGNTLAEIAGEKAGIIKAGVPLVTSPQQEEARQVIARVAAERQAPLIQVGIDLVYERESSSLDEGQTLRVWEPDRPDLPPVQLAIRLLGAHQVDNAATAYAALLACSRQGLPLTAEAIAQGFRQATWPARFEILQRDPPVVIDSAHNRDSALKLCRALDEYFPGLPVILLFGASEDKDIAGMFAELMPRVSQMVATKSIHPRAAAPETLASLAAPYGCPVTVVDELEEALERALQLSAGQALVLITGSIFVAAGGRESWYKMNKETS
jgi:dihydrofolate synthase/folylpolyglutamate synthase